MMRSLSLRSRCAAASIRGSLALAPASPFAVADDDEEEGEAFVLWAPAPREAAEEALARLDAAPDDFAAVERRDEALDDFAAVEPLADAPVDLPVLARLPAAPAGLALEREPEPDFDPPLLDPLLLAWGICFLLHGQR
jgi:hypothetical protein